MKIIRWNGFFPVFHVTFYPMSYPYNSALIFPITYNTHLYSGDIQSLGGLSIELNSNEAGTVWLC